MSMESYEREQVCPVCKRKAQVTANPPGIPVLWVKCEKCGEYILDETLFESAFSSKLKMRSCLYYYLSQQTPALNEKKIIPLFYNDASVEDGGISKIRQKQTKMISITSVMNIFPSDVNERIAMIMVNLGNEVQYIGNTFSLKPLGDPDKSHLFFLDEDYGAETIKDQMDGIIKWLESQYLIDEYMKTHDLFTYSIAPAGWELISEYRKIHQTLPQAFIAMWFDDGMLPAKAKIMSAIEACGYIPMPIDAKEYIGQIVPEIFYEIKRSEFVVVDLTGGRGGVYYEAGYAEALEKPVIMCCRSDYLNQLHFDVKQKNAIVWTDIDDLHDRLIKRIESTIGKRK